ncbi:MAG: APC family permease [Methanomicrobiales archaeon]|jgi:APA family basic amino acid/polyamine antiporter
MGAKIPLKRELGLFEVTLSGIGIIIGAGIYALIGRGAGLAGNALWLSFAISAAIAIFTGLSYAELSAMFPRAGAEYEYVKGSLGRRPAFVIGWLIILSGVIGASTVALGFAGYASALSGIDRAVLSLGLIIGLTLLLTRGIKLSALFAILFTLIEVAGLVLIILIGIPSYGRVDYLEMPLGLSGVLTAASLVFFAYIGFEGVVKLAEETREPERNIPRGLLAAMAVSIVLYILVSISAVSVIGWEALAASEAPFAAVAGRALGGGASLLLSAIALFATANTVLLMLLASSRISYGMADAGHLPAILGYVHETQGTPVWATLVIGAGACIFTLFGDIGFAAELTNFTLFLTFLVINASVILLRIRHPCVHRPFRVPGSLRGIPLLPVAGVAASVALLTRLDPVVIGLGMALVVIGSGYAILKVPAKNGKDDDRASS